MPVSTGSVRSGPARAAPLASRLLVLATVLLCTILGAVAPARAADPDFPALTGRVVDAANVLPAAARDEIAAKLRAHEERTSDQVVVATVPGLGDLAVEEYANRLFRTWHLGEAGTNNGVLLLVAPAARKVRIEVGYGVEGALTDALSKVIIATQIAPRFRVGDYAGGISAGVDAILATLASDADEWGRRPKVREDSGSTVDPVLVIVLVIFVVILVASLLGGARGAGRPHRTRGGRWIAVPSPGSSGSRGGSGGGWSGGSSSGSSGGSSGGWSGDASGSSSSSDSFSGGGGSSGGGGASGDW